MATITATELATELGITGREVRKFLRSITPKDAQPGKGSRWAIEKKELRALRTKHTAYQKAQEERAAAKEAELEDEADGPTAEDLAAIEAEA